MSLKSLSLFLLLIISLWGLPSLNAQPEDGWKYIEVNGGLNVAITPDRMSSAMAINMQYFLLDGVGLRQIGGVSVDHGITLGAYPVRKLYRYYNEENDVRQTIAVCGKTVQRMDQDSTNYSEIGTPISDYDSVFATTGDSMLIGYNTNWLPLKGEHDGEGWTIEIFGTTYDIEKIYSSNLMEITDTIYEFIGTDTATLACYISIPAGDGYVDMTSFDNLLFIANGTDPVFRWDGSYLNHDYYMIDSFTIDSILEDGSSLKVKPQFWFHGTTGLQGHPYHLDTLGRYQSGIYADSIYSLIVEDSNSTTGYSRPWPITGIDSIYPYNQLSIDRVDPTMLEDSHFCAGQKAYVVLPLCQVDKSFSIDRYAIDIDTVYSGIVDSSYQDKDTAEQAVYTYLYDWDQTWTTNEFNAGAYVLRLKYIGTDATASGAIVDELKRGYPFIGHKNGVDSIGIRFVWHAATGSDVNNSLGDSCEYMILRFYYYPRSQFVEGHNNRVWFGNDVVSDDRIIYSDIQDPNVLKGDYGLNHFYTNKGDKSWINGLSSVSDRLRIYTNDGLYILIGADIYDFQMRKIFKYGIGVTSPYSLVSHGYTDFFFGSDDGIYSYNAVDSAPRYLCEAVQDIFLDSMNQDYKDKVQLGIFHDRMWVGYPDGSDTNVSNGLVYDFDGFWSILDSNKFCGGDYVVKDLEGDGDTVLFGNTNGAIYRYGVSDLYAGSAINAVYQTAWLDFGYPSMLKMIDKIIVKYHKSDTAQIALWMYKDGSGTAFWNDTIGAAAENSKYDQLILNVDPELGDRFSLKLQGIEADSLRITQIGFHVEYYRDDD